jgi:hypothetical protein
MDTNTKIIILVLILVFIKFFIPSIDNFADTSTQKEICKREFVPVSKAIRGPCGKKDTNGYNTRRCLSCPHGLSLKDDMCFKEKIECTPNPSYKPPPGSNPSSYAPNKSMVGTESDTWSPGSSGTILGDDPNTYSPIIPMIGSDPNSSTRTPASSGTQSTNSMVGTESDTYTPEYINNEYRYGYGV